MTTEEMQRSLRQIHELHDRLVLLASLPHRFGPIEAPPGATRVDDRCRLCGQDTDDDRHERAQERLI